MKACASESGRIFPFKVVFEEPFFGFLLVGEAWFGLGFLAVCDLRLEGGGFGKLGPTKENS